MATQYTAGFSPGTKNTAAIMNSIGAAWETWTPTITPTSGTFTTITTNVARYARLQTIVVANLDFTITSVGTGSGVVQFTLPVATRSGANGLTAGAFREIAVSGFTGVVGVADSGVTTVGSLRRYDNASYIAANLRFSSFFIYEAA